MENQTISLIVIVEETSKFVISLYAYIEDVQTSKFVPDGSSQVATGSTIGLSFMLRIGSCVCGD